MMKKLLAVLLTVCLVAVMCPFSVSAATVVASGNCGKTNSAYDEATPSVKWSLDSEGTLTISGTGDMKDYFFPEEPGWVSDYAVKKLIIQNGVTNISRTAFSGCRDLSDVTIPTSVTEIKEAAFSYCDSLTTIKIPNSVTSLGDSVFRNSGIKSITIPDSIRSLPMAIFMESELVSITLPKSLSEIGGSAFCECKKLTSITIPNGVSEIYDFTFAGCTNLTSVLIPTSVTTISGGTHESGDNFIIAIPWEAAFENCVNLKDVYYAGTEAQWKKINIGEKNTYNKYLTSAAIHYNSSSIPNPPTPPTPPKPTVGGFNDVHEGDYCADAVIWAVNKGVTTGKGSEKFAPNDSCTRGEIVTFLWRAAGQPEPTTTGNPFADVKESDFFYKPVLWAAENNVTGGTGINADGKAVFSPGNSCTRAQAMTFQWRAAGEPTPSTSGTFADVPSGSYYADAVSWALENEITNGMGGGKFGSGNSCTRGQIVTFLYRGRDVA